MFLLFLSLTGNERSKRRQVVNSAHVAWEVCWGQCLTCCKGSCLYTRDTREGWPLLTVETEVNVGSKSTNEPWLICWACRASTRDFCSASAALVGLIQNIYLLTVHYFNCLSPSPSKLGRQPCWVAWNLVCVSDLWSLPLLLSRRVAGFASCSVYPVLLKSVLSALISLILIELCHEGVLCTWCWLYFESAGIQSRLAWCSCLQIRLQNFFNTMHVNSWARSCGLQKMFLKSESS